MMIPKGVVHGQTKITKESYALFYWDGPRAQELV